MIVTRIVRGTFLALALLCSGGVDAPARAGTAVTETAFLTEDEPRNREYFAAYRAYVDASTYRGKGNWKSAEGKAEESVRILERIGSADLARTGKNGYRIGRIAESSICIGVHTIASTGRGARPGFMIAYPEPECFDFAPERLLAGIRAEHPPALLLELHLREPVSGPVSALEVASVDYENRGETKIEMLVLEIGGANGTSRLALGEVPADGQRRGIEIARVDTVRVGPALEVGARWRYGFGTDVPRVAIP